MRTLSEKQEEFLLDTFFKLEKVDGWRNIATSLLENGTCIVAGDKRVWIGGVGNFISINSANPHIYGCAIYKFDLEQFLSSEWFKETTKSYLSEFKADYSLLGHKITEITELFANPEYNLDDELDRHLSDLDENIIKDLIVDSSKNIIDKCLSLKNEILSEAFTILYDKEWKATFGHVYRANLMRTILKSNDQPCRPFINWVWCLDYLYDQVKKSNL